MIAMVCILTHERPRTLKRPRPVYLYIEYGDIFSANCLPSHTECARFLKPLAQICYVVRDCVEFARIISNICSKKAGAIARKNIEIFFASL